MTRHTDIGFVNQSDDNVFSLAERRERMDTGERLPAPEFVTAGAVETLRIEDTTASVVGSLPVPREASEAERELLRTEIAGHLEEARSHLFEVLKKSDRIGDRRLHVATLIEVAELDSRREELAKEYGE